MVVNGGGEENAVWMGSAACPVLCCGAEDANDIFHDPLLHLCRRLRVVVRVGGPSER